MSLMFTATLACGPDDGDSDACESSSFGDSGPVDVLLLVDHSSSLTDAGGELALAAPDRGLAPFGPVFGDLASSL